jgi:hypothetical protein
VQLAEAGANEEIEAKIGKILQGAEAPDCDLDFAMIAEAGLCAPDLFFSSLFCAIG